MTALDTYHFPATGQDVQPVRTVMVDGEPWFIAADVCTVLEIANPYSSLALLDHDEKGLHSMETPGGEQQFSVVSEAGLYSLILRSRKPQARQFKRWITHDVLPAIRRTGRYDTEPATTVDHLDRRALAQMVIEAEDAREAAEKRAAELAPRAESWDVLASGDGDYSVGDAAKNLTRAGLQLGERRLFTLLSEWGWITRSRADGRWRPYQTAVETGRLSLIPQSHYHPRTGELVTDPPQVRVTPKGLHEIRRRLTEQAQRLAIGAAS